MQQESSSPRVFDVLADTFAQRQTGIDHFQVWQRDLVDERVKEAHGGVVSVDQAEPVLVGHHRRHNPLIAKAREVDAKLVYFANPDNPMGTWHGAGTVQEMIDNIPDGAVDEKVIAAYRKAAEKEIELR